jgi:hypothetical protein
MYGKKSRFLFLPWPVAVFLLLSAGVLLAGWTLRTAAADLTVRAEVHAAPPTGPASISLPTNGSHFSNVPITVSGSCPADGSGAYIKLYRNNVFSGSALCQGDKTFQLSSDLFPGANSLMARIYNITDDAGPDSSAVTVYYDVPQQPAKNPSSPPGKSIPPFVIKSDVKYVGYYVDQTVKWQLEAAGGVAPYAVHIDWGDGKSTNLSLKNEGPFSISHVYSSPGHYKNSYKIAITASDYEQRQTYLELFVLINPPVTGPVAGIIQPNPPPAVKNQWLWLAWPAYMIVALMALSFWLGEREEALILDRRGLLLKRRS